MQGPSDSKSGFPSSSTSPTTPSTPPPPHSSSEMIIPLEHDTKKVQAEWSTAEPPPPFPGPSSSASGSSSSGSNATPSVSGTGPNVNSGHKKPFSNPQESQTDHFLVDIPEPQQDYDEPPPDFVPYQAEFFEVGYEDIVSHDPHLNTDGSYPIVIPYTFKPNPSPQRNHSGEALYRFLLAEAESPPVYRLKCNGTHTETRYRWVTDRDANGRTRERQESYNETITDFDFYIDIKPEFVEEPLDPSHPHFPPADPHMSGFHQADRPLRKPREPVHWSVPDDEPVYRGKMIREWQDPISGERKKATRKETKEYKKWVGERNGRGYPPWARQTDMPAAQLGRAAPARGGRATAPRATPGSASVRPSAAARTSSTGSNSTGSGVVAVGGVAASAGGAAASSSGTRTPVTPTADALGLRSSKTLRQWADEYCASPKHLKEFTYQKVLYGWDFEQIKEAVHSTIAQATSYSGNITVEIVPYNSKIHVRPNNRLARWISNKWIKFIYMILLVYPFIWLFKRFHSKGGGRWEVCGGAYAMKAWVPLTEEEREEVDQLPPYNPFGDPAAPSQVPWTMTTARTKKSLTYRQTPWGLKKLVGMKEGEWLKHWEYPIKRGVYNRDTSGRALPPPDSLNTEADELDGYREAPAPLVSY